MARILIVDDEPLITAMLEDWLSELGDIVVGPAHSLARALELADGDIDAAIVDLSLGDDNSYPVLEALTARRLPFALATGHGQESIEPRYHEQVTLTKPFEFATFRQALDRLRAAEPGAGADAPNSSSPRLSRRP